jgi:uncharacterized membrane protein
MTAEGQPVVTAPTATAEPAKDPLADPRALQILTTEHWSLLSARSLAYNEAFSRAGMFLSFLSATLIVIGFLIAADALAEAVLPVVALLLALDLFVGLATLGRLSDASAEEFIAIRGMNRIRHGYSELVPGIELYFVSPTHDDARGVLATFGGVASLGILPNLLHGLTTAVGMVAILDCVLLSALVAMVAAGLGTGTAAAIVLGAVTFALAFVVSSFLGMRAAMRSVARHEAMFPTPD